MLIALGVGGVVAAFGLVAVFLRRVVPTNEVHIVQSAGKTISYGKDTVDGNSYYEWPSWIPVIGISKIKLPVSVFDLDLPNYEAYDEGRLPFIVHIKAFFRISDSNTAAQRIASFQELNEQLEAIVQGAVRSILASNSIEEIMHGRSKFGEQFTNAVKEQLIHWGVEAVKNIELMDIRDAQGSHVIQNIMSKRKSEIEMQSRVEVAKNQKTAQMAEIEAGREVELQNQQAKQAVGMRQVEAQRQVSVATQEANQAIKDAEKATKEKEMAVARVAATRQAEIEREVALLKAEQDKKSQVLAAEGQLEATKLSAEGVAAQGTAKAQAEKLLLLAPVEAQTSLAKEIGQNEGYQKYLITVRQVEASQAVGIEQAKALEKSDIKIIVNSGSPAKGVSNVMDLFSSGGGVEVGAMLEGLAQTGPGKALLAKFGIDGKQN